MFLNFSAVETWLFTDKFGMNLISRAVVLLFFVLLSITLSAQEPDSSTKNHISSTDTQTTAIQVNIVITGLNGEQKQNALAYLELRKSLDDPHFSESWLKKLHNKAEQNIKESLQPFGYYHATIKKTLTHKTKQQWLAQYNVDRGEPVRVTQLKILISEPGESDPQVKHLVDTFSLKKDAILVHSLYENARDTFVNDIGRLGYSKIKILEHKVIINPKNKTAEVQMSLESGSKYTLGKFHFLQNDILNEDFILKYLQNIRSGMPQSQEILLDLQNTLLRTGYFSKVDVKPDFNQANDKNEVPINITLEPSKRHKFSVGAGFDTEIQAFLTMRWQHRRINQYGHNSDVSTKLSSKKSFIRGAYWIPVGDPSTDKIGLISKLETEDTDTTDRTTFDVEVGYWFKWQKWDSTVFTEFRQEKFTSGSEPKVTTELLSLGARLERANFEKARFPRRGWAFFGEIRGAGEGILSDIDYYRLQLKSRLYLPIAENGRIFLRGELGLADTSNFDLYPSSLRFYAGGDQSVRGYKWKALGPKDDEGNVIGGKNVVTGSIEYDHQVSTDWVLAGFVDAGNAYNDQLNTIFYGAGFGLRYISPVGLVRADLGFPIKSDDDISDDNFVFYFGFEMSL